MSNFPTSSDFEQGGYKPFPANSSLTHTHASQAWQKRVSGVDGTTHYFVNVYVYEPRELSPGQGWQGGWSAEARLYPRYGGFESFDLEAHCEDGTSLTEVECFFACAYVQMQCRPDPHNQRGES